MTETAAESKQTIICIEDNPENLSLVVRILESTGKYRVLGAPDGEMGLELINKEYPVLVLLDLDIPGLNGFEVTRQIKASADSNISKIPVAAISANVLADERQASLDAGCVDFIEKPFDLRNFRTQIQRLIEESS